MSAHARLLWGWLIVALVGVLIEASQAGVVGLTLVLIGLLGFFATTAASVSSRRRTRHP